MKVCIWIVAIVAVMSSCGNDALVSPEVLDQSQPGTQQEQSYRDAMPGWEHYEYATIAQILADVYEEALQYPDGTLELWSTTFRCDLVFCGDCRPITDAAAGFIACWARLSTADPSYMPSIYTTEYLFLEDRREHWIPIQNSLLTDFMLVPEGERCEVYLVFLGYTLSAVDGFSPHIVASAFRDLE